MKPTDGDRFLLRYGVFVSLNFLTVTVHGAAIELKQFKAFKHNAGKMFTKLYDGTEVLSTAEAIKAEIVEVIRRLEGGERAKLKANMGKLRVMMEKSRKDGKSRQAMEAISQYFGGS